MKNVNGFEAVRAAVKNRTNQGIQATQETVNQTTQKVLGAAKATSSFIAGYMPVTHNALDDRTEELLRLIAMNQLEMEQLRRQLNVQRPSEEADVDMVDQITSYYMQAFKEAPIKEMKKAAAKAAKKDSKAAPAPSEMEVVQSAEPVVLEPEEYPTELEVVSKKPSVKIQMSQPSDWHLGQA